VLFSFLKEREFKKMIRDSKRNKRKEGMQVTMEEKKAWAEDLLRSKYAELGKLPAKKDFDSVTCSRIKAYLGPWHRALESAGLKSPKEKTK